MFNFIFENNPIQWVFRAIFILMFIFYLKNYLSSFGKKPQMDSNLKRGRYQMMFFGLISVIIGICGYFAKLYLLGGPAFFFATNPFLFIILRTDNAENQIVFETIFPGIIEGFAFLMNGILILVLASLLWLTLNRKIKQIKYAP